MRNDLQLKYTQLKDFFHEHEEVVIAYSGAIENVLLLKVAKDEISDEVIALMGKTASMPEREFEDALFLARELGVEPVVIKTKEIDSPDYCSNPLDRCYHCKKHIFGSFDKFMKENELIHLLDGSISDSSTDYKFKIKAIKEFNVTSPLKDLEFTKDDVKDLLKELGLSTWRKEKMACLASRIAFNDPITIDRLKKIDQAEELLRTMDFTHVRVRLQNNTVRIEVDAAEVQRFFNLDIRKKVLVEMKELGFQNISIDMDGNTKESMNEN